MGRKNLSLSFLRGELEINPSKYARKNTNNSKLERLMKENE